MGCTTRSTPEAYRAYLARSASARPATSRAGVEDDALVGWLNLGEIVRGELRRRLPRLRRVRGVHAGQGYMTEALELVLREAFVTLELHRLEANIQPGNAASIALVQRLGFELEGLSPRYLKIGGRWRDHER